MNGLREAWLHSPLTNCAYHLTSLVSAVLSVKWVTVSPITWFFEG